MYKNQLQELAQRSCFNLPSYSCIREGPDHAPRFKATVNFNGDTFESPSFCSTLRQAEHSAAEIALNTLANRGPSKALAAKILDETGVYKNLLQETAHRAGLNLPIYTTVRSGPGHVPVFSCTVELAGLTFSGEPAKTKKQAQKNAAMSAWSTLKQLAQRGPSPTTSSPSPSESDISNEEQEQVVIARLLSTLQPPKPNTSTSTPQHLAHNSIDPNNPTPSTLSYTNWAYWNFCNEMAMYRTWQQAQLSHHHTTLLSLPVPPPPPPLLPPAHQILPFIPSVFHPNQLYFPQTVRPGLIGSSNPGPSTSMGRSKVTIQEIQEEKTEELSPTVQYSRAGPNQIEVKLQNLRVSEPLNNNNNYNNNSSSSSSSNSNFRPNQGPVRIQTVGPRFSVRPRPPNSGTTVRAPPGMRTGGAVGLGVRSRFMAPAVQIRSVVPVCSAPPARKAGGSSQDVKSGDKDKKGGEKG